MTVSVKLVKVEYDAQGTDLYAERVPVAIVYFLVEREERPPLSFTFKISQFESLDAAVIQAQNQLVAFAQELQKAATAPVV